MLIHAGDVVIHRRTHTKHMVTEAEIKVLNCGIRITKRIKISNVLICDQLAWHNAMDFRLIEGDDL